MTSSRNQKTLSRLALGLAAATALGLAAAPATAATFQVNSYQDAPDNRPGDGLCEANLPTQEQVRCTLRAAIMESNALFGVDRILLRGGTYRLTVAGYSTETDGRVGDLDIRDKLIIEGKGRDRTTIDAGPLAKSGDGTSNRLASPDRVFDIHSPAVVAISGVTIKGGRAMGPPNLKPPTDDNGNVLPPECPVVKPADGADGGGILNRGAVVQLKDIRLMDNRALCDGGGIETVNDAVMLLSDCELTMNVALANGGGLENDEDSILLVTDCTFTWNNAKEHGGALAADDSLTWMKGVTMRLNAALGNGGGIWNGDSDAMIVKESTIRYNDAADGGGIFNNDGFLRLLNNEIDRNSPNDIVDEEIPEGLPSDNIFR